MKKQFFYAALAIALMSSCSKDNDPGITPEPENPTPDVIDDTTPVAIELGIGNPSVVATRGTGSVGDLEGDVGNVWNGQQLKIYMFPKNKIETAYISPIANYSFNAPTTGTSGKVTIQDGSVPYYPMQGAFDFYAYHMDTEVTNANPNAVLADGSFTVTGKIDGTNDVMSAVASLSLDDQIQLLTEYHKNDTPTPPTFKKNTAGDDIVNGDDSPLSEADKVILEKEKQKAFSSYAARRTIQPSLTFKHLLTRLKFKVKAGEESAAKDKYTDGTIAAMADHNFPDLETLTEEQKSKLANGEIIDLPAKIGGVSAGTDGAVYIQSIKVIDQQDNVVLTFTPGTAPVYTVDANGVATGVQTKATLPICTPTFSASDPLASFTLMGRTTAGPDVTQPTGAIALTPTATETFGTATPVGESIMIVPEQESFKIQIIVMQYVVTNTTTGTYTWKLSQMTSTVKAPTTMPDPEDPTKSITSTDQKDGKYIFATSKSYNINITVYSYQKIDIDAVLTGWIPGSDVEVNPGDDAFE